MYVGGNSKIVLSVIGLLALSGCLEEKKIATTTATGSLVSTKPDGNSEPIVAPNPGSNVSPNVPGANYVPPPKPLCELHKVILKTSSAEVEYSTIQAAVIDANSGDAVQVGKGPWLEQVILYQKSNLKIQSDCLPDVYGFVFSGNENVTVSGFSILGLPTGSHGIALLKAKSDQSDKSDPNLGDEFSIDTSSLIKKKSLVQKVLALFKPSAPKGNNKISLIGNKIKGIKGNYDGIYVSREQSEINIEHNDISLNDGDGITFNDSPKGGAYFVKSNTIALNGKNGILISKFQSSLLENNIIINNGRLSKATEQGYGINRNGEGPKSPKMATLIGNVIISNNGKVVKNKSSADLEFYSSYLDSTDSNNQTTTGLEGLGVSKFIDQQAPLSSVISPIATATANSNFEFTVQVSDQSLVNTYVYQNGRQIFKSTEYTFKVFTTLVEGLNSFEITSTDAYGKSSLSSLAITLDTTAPVISPVSTDTIILSKVPQTVIYSIKSDSKLSFIAINGISVPVPTPRILGSAATFALKMGLMSVQSTDSSYVYDVPLTIESVGTGTYNITAADEMGNVSQSSFTIQSIIDSDPPVVYLGSSQSIFAKEVPINRTVYLYFNEPVQSLVVNGISASLDSVYYANVPVNFTSAGNNVIDAVATDLAGNEGHYIFNVQVIIDNAAPIVTSDLPSLKYTSASDIVPTIRINDDSPVNSFIRINGNLQFQTTSTAFAVFLNMPSDGNYNLEIQTVDEAGNSTTFSQVFIKDSVAPVLSSVVPASGATLTSRTVKVSATSNEALAELKINGEYYPLSQNQSDFQKYILYQADGSSTVRIQVKDFAGNETVLDVPININTGSQFLWTYAECSAE
jgi:hypothetical protein